MKLFHVKDHPEIEIRANTAEEAQSKYDNIVKPMLFKTPIASLDVEEKIGEDLE